MLISPPRRLPYATPYAAAMLFCAPPYRALRELMCAEMGPPRACVTPRATRAVFGPRVPRSAMKFCRACADTIFAGGAAGAPRRTRGASRHAACRPCRYVAVSWPELPPDISRQRLPRVGSVCCHAITYTPQDDFRRRRLRAYGCRRRRCRTPRWRSGAPGGAYETIRMARIECACCWKRCQLTLNISRVDRHMRRACVAGMCSTEYDVASPPLPRPRRAYREVVTSVLHHDRHTRRVTRVTPAAAD